MNKNDYKLAYEYIYNYCKLDEDAFEWPLMIDSFKIFKELVNKETPKKPNIEDIGYDQYKNENVYGIFCPNCNEIILELTDSDLDEDIDKFVKHFKQKFDTRNWQYCSYCGQKLNWDDEND